MTKTPIDPIHSKLLAAEILDQIADDEDKYLLPKTHWDARALCQQPMSKADDAALILNPRNRARFNRAIHEARKSFLAEAANNNTPVAVAAARGGRRSDIRFDEAKLKHFSILMRPSGAIDWLIFCERKAGTKVFGSEVELRDDMGRVWLKSPLDTEGRVTARLTGIDDARATAQRGLSLFFDGSPLGSVSP